MDAADFIEHLKYNVTLLISAVVTMVAGMVALFFIYREDRKRSEKLSIKINDDFLQVVKEDIETKKDLTKQIEATNKILEGFSYESKDKNRILSEFSKTLEKHNIILERLKK